MQAVKLTSGCEIKEKNNQWGERRGCPGAELIALCLCIQCNWISGLRSSSSASLMRCDFERSERVTRSRRDIWFICSLGTPAAGSDLSSIPVHTQQAQSSRILNGQRGIREKLPCIINTDMAIPLQNFPLSHGIVIPSSVDWILNGLACLRKESWLPKCQED